MLVWLMLTSPVADQRFSSDAICSRVDANLSAGMNYLIESNTYVHFRGTEKRWMTAFQKNPGKISKPKHAKILRINMRTPIRQALDYLIT